MAGTADTADLDTKTAIQSMIDDLGLQSSDDNRESEKESKDEDKEIIEDKEEDTEETSDETDEEEEAEEEQSDGEDETDDEDEKSGEDEDEGKDEISFLRTQIDRLQRRLDVSDEKDSPPPKPVKQFEMSEEDHEHLTGGDRDEANKVVTKIVQAAAQAGAQQATQQFQIQRSVDTFYEENPGLKKHYKLVGRIANEVSAENPKMSLKDVLSETLKELGPLATVRNEAEEKEKIRRKTNAKKPTSTGKSSKTKPKGKEKDPVKLGIMEMIKSHGR